VAPAVVAFAVGAHCAGGGLLGGVELAQVELNPRVINLDTAFSQQLLHVPIGQAVAQVPPHRHHDHLRRETEPREARPRRRYSTMATTHQLSLPEHVIGQRNSPLPGDPVSRST
jgi:hypothetical protein